MELTGECCLIPTVTEMPGQSNKRTTMNYTPALNCCGDNTQGYAIGDCLIWQYKIILYYIADKLFAD
jgi:hypothetical protein